MSYKLILLKKKKRKLKQITSLRHQGVLQHPSRSIIFGLYLGFISLLLYQAGQANRALR